MSHLLLQKKYPQQYPLDAVEVIRAMTFSKGKTIEIIGSSALRSQQYAGDYDINEIVEIPSTTDAKAVAIIAKEFKEVVRRLQKMENAYIADIKCGVIEEWRVFPEKSHTKEGVKKKVAELFESNIINSKEAGIALSLINPTRVGHLKARDEVKFHIIRWTPEQILAGKQTLRDGRSYSLEEAIVSPSIVKLDIIALVQSKYTEFAVIYEFHNGKKILNPTMIDVEKSLKDSIILYSAEGNPFKVLKRKFALAKLTNRIKDLEKYHSILNSEIGKLYIVYTDVSTLVSLLEDTTIPKDKLAEAINGFTHRLTRIYSLEDYLKGETKLLADLDKAMKAKDPKPILQAVADKLFGYISKNTLEKSAK
jgi:hypothetical protein